MPIKKANGTWRFCIDFRPLNAVTRLDSQPLPRISDLVRAVGGSKYFAALDLRSGYWQIAMSPESIPYTAFRCCGGLYEFTVMPFGLVNAPATFQRAMMTVLSDLVDQGVQVYLDDILVHASTFCECHVLLADVLNRLERAGLTVNLQKCVFYPHEVLYLGHLLGGGTRRPNPKRVDILSRWKIPTNVSELRSLLGALTYYHEYVPRFAELARRPSDLLRGLSKQEAKAKSKHPIVWPEECTADINAVVSALRTAILSLPDEADGQTELLLETDASDSAYAAILSVKDRTGQWRPIEFASKKFAPHEQRWHTQEKEAYAIVAALRHWACYCRGRPVRVHTDHASLQWLLKATKGKCCGWDQ